jgi:hypothetical protein
MIPTKQKWRVKKKTSTPTLTAFDGDMDLLDVDKSPLMKDGSPPPISMDVNMVIMLPTEFRGDDKKVAQLCLIPKEAMFEHPEESSQHLKLLYIRGHIDGRPISMTLIDQPDSQWREGNLMEARGVVSMELIVGSKSLATAFFVIEVQGNYSVILGRDWIHANRCVPSTWHQFLIQWIDDEIEVVHADASAYIALADATAAGSMGAPSACRGRILQATTFLASPRKDLYSCLCS